MHEKNKKNGCTFFMEKFRLNFRLVFRLVRRMQDGCRNCMRGN